MRQQENGAIGTLVMIKNKKIFIAPNNLELEILVDQKNSIPLTSNEIWTFILEIYIVSVLCQLTKDS
ncbi:hypothetical protein OAV81_00945 [Candidatus Thioglobus sp.]|nr:hypothetical protein [Candidatus Thioglobus sp.]